MWVSVVLGFDPDGLFNKWRPQAWRMEIISLDGPPQPAAVAPAGAVLSEGEKESP